MDRHTCDLDLRDIPGVVSRETPLGPHNGNCHNEWLNFALRTLTIMAAKSRNRSYREAVYNDMPKSLKVCRGSDETRQQQ